MSRNLWFYIIYQGLNNVTALWSNNQINQSLIYFQVQFLAFETEYFLFMSIGRTMKPHLRGHSSFSWFLVSHSNLMAMNHFKNFLNKTIEKFLKMNRWYTSTRANWIKSTIQQKVIICTNSCAFSAKQAIDTQNVLTVKNLHLEFDHSSMMWIEWMTLWWNDLKCYLSYSSI